MKKIFTKQALYSLIAAAAFLFAACVNPVTPPPGADGASTPGTGQLRVIITDNAVRTIYPSTVFDHYEYAVFRVGETTGQQKTPDDNGVFTLETGNWFLLLDAYATASSDSLVASGKTDPFTITEGQLTDNVMVSLDLRTGEGTGTLHYTITYPAGAGLGTLRFGTSDLLSEASISPDNGTATGTKTIASGWGIVSFLFTATLTKDGKTAGKSEAVHIYTDFTTEVALTFTAEDFTAYIDSDILYTGTDTSPQPNTGTLALALDWLQSNAEANTNYTILLGADEDLPPRTLGGGTSSGIGVTLKGRDSIRTVQLSGSGSLFTLESGLTLSLGENISLKGGVSNNYTSLVRVNSGAELILKDGAKISGNLIVTSSSTYGYGGGVYIASSGSFTMEGGEISGNTTGSYVGGSFETYGGGVYVHSQGTFAMKGGKISGNKASSTNSSYGGGVYVQGQGTFAMAGGEISGNTTASTSSYSYGGGVYVDGSGTFTMEDGEISGNRAFSDIYYYGGGVFNHGTFTMQDGKISGNYGRFGSGVYNGATFTLKGGEISGNRAIEGGGVCNSGTFTMEDGKISGNGASDGGGVYVASGTFTMEDGEILGNGASSTSSSASPSGGGVYIASGTFTMEGGEISGNTSSSNSGAATYGGGVYVTSSTESGTYKSGTFTIKGGTVYGSDGEAKANKLEGSGIKQGISLYKSSNGKAQYGDATDIISGTQTAALPKDLTITGHN